MVLYRLATKITQFTTCRFLSGFHIKFVAFIIAHHDTTNYFHCQYMSFPNQNSILCEASVPIFLKHCFDLFRCVLSSLTIFFICCKCNIVPCLMPLIQFNTLFDKFLLNFLCKPLDKATDKFGGMIMYKGKYSN